MCKMSANAGIIYMLANALTINASFTKCQPRERKKCTKRKAEPTNLIKERNALTPIFRLNESGERKKGRQIQ